MILQRLTVSIDFIMLVQLSEIDDRYSVFVNNSHLYSEFALIIVSIFTKSTHTIVGIYNACSGFLRVKGNLGAKLQDLHNSFCMSSIMHIFWT